MHTIYRHWSGDWLSLTWRNRRLLLDEPRRLLVAPPLYAATMRLGVRGDDQPTRQFLMVFVLAAPDDWTSGCGVVQTNCRQHCVFQAPALALQVAHRQGILSEEQYGAAMKAVGGK